MAIEGKAQTLIRVGADVEPIATPEPPRRQLTNLADVPREELAAVLGHLQGDGCIVKDANGDYYLFTVSIMQ